VKGAATGMIFAAVMLSAIASGTALAIIPDMVLAAIGVSTEAGAATEFSEFSGDVETACDEEVDRMGTIRLDGDYSIDVNPGRLVFRDDGEEIDDYYPPTDCSINGDTEEIEDSAQYELNPDNGDLELTLS